jgi:acylphosphatase
MMKSVHQEVLMVIVRGLIQGLCFHWWVVMVELLVEEISGCLCSH